MKGAIGDALRKADTRKPQPGDMLSVTYTGDGTPPQPGFNGPKLFKAVYTPKQQHQPNNSSTAKTPKTGLPMTIRRRPASRHRVGNHARRGQTGDPRCRRRRTPVLTSSSPP